MTEEWQAELDFDDLEKRIAFLLEHYGANKEVQENTPRRVIKMWKEMMAGTLERPEKVLMKGFEIGKDYDQMIVITDIPLVSLCEHHLMPFVGKAHFGYLPTNAVVGLSKIPRMIDILSRRPQLQERLGQQIVTVFQQNAKPNGCGVVIEAEHTCMTARGAKAMGSFTKTTALQGNFKQDTVKAEFLSHVGR